MLIQEEMFNALIDFLIDRKVCSESEASVMLRSLAQRFRDHANGKTETDYAVHKTEILEQAARLEREAALIGQ